MSGVRALVVGIDDYGAHAPRLAGCANDAHTLADFLEAYFGYDPRHIKVLRDAQATRREVIGALERLAADSVGLDHVWISFAGHGLQVPTAPATGGGASSESDGRDEGLLCADGEYILDDDLHKILCRFDVTCAVTVVIDACHSGTVGDLEYVYTGGFKEGASASLGAAGEHFFPRASVLLLSACRDAECASEAWDAGKRRMGGALTGALLRTLARYGYTVRCWELLKALTRELQACGFGQRPQLSASLPVDDATMWCRGAPDPARGCLTFF